MGKLTKNHLIEAAIWLGFAFIAFVYTFEFDQPIEIYRYGASTWPRGVILLIAVAALGQLYWHWRYGDDVSETTSAVETGAVPPESEDGTERALTYYLRIGAILVLPLAYAMLLENVGFYALTPVFIACIIYLMGERRWLWILGVTAAVYVVIVFVFAKLLYTGLPVGNVSPFYEFSNWLLVLLRGTN